MALQPYEQFKGVSDWNKDTFSDNLQFGVMDWCNWSMLNIGAFQNVLHSHANGIYGGHAASLRLVDDPYFTSGQVWEGARSNWVWESGVAYTTQPRACSGVYVDGAFKPTISETGVYKHYIDYPRGRVVFDSAIPTTSTVRTDYAYRTVGFHLSKEPWFTELLYKSFDVSTVDFQSASGAYNRLAQTRRQMPAVGVELATRGNYSPYQLGGGQWVHQDILMYIVAENKTDRDRLINILCDQNDKVIYLYDKSLMKTSSQFPVDIDLKGRPVTDAMHYPQIIAATGDGGYRWARVMLRNVYGQTMDSLNDWLYKGSVRLTCEAIFENI